VSQGSGRTVAIIGMAGRFPDAPDLDAFWRNIEVGRECLTRLSADQLRAAGVPAEWAAHPDYVPVCAVLDDSDRFDAEVFGFSPREAALLDPQHRLFLECSWAALEHAGRLDARGRRSRVGVFGGAGGVFGGYVPLVLASGPLRHPVASEEHLSNDKDFLTARVSHRLNLTGPSLAVQTSCSTALVALHLACRSLLDDECDLALAGSVTIRVPQHAGYFFREGGIFSRTGRVRPFDAEADGTVLGSGVGVVVLKMLDSAVRDGDTVYATVLGTAISNDGGDKLSFIAPSADGIYAAASRAISNAGVDPASLGYIETQGTAGPLGDAIEIAALSRAVGGARCAVGSVKAMVGNLEAASGIASLLKTVLALRAGVVPPSPYFGQPHPRVRLSEDGLHVDRLARPWPAGVRRAAVNSFAMGGMNAFAVLEAAPGPQATGPARSHELITLSAMDKTTLRELAIRWRDRLRVAAPSELGDLAHTAAVGRRRLRHRLSVVAVSPDEAADRITAWLDGAIRPDGVEYGTARGGQPRLALAFPGQGSQYPAMAEEFYRDHQDFRAYLDQWSPLFAELTGRSAIDALADPGLGRRPELLQPAVVLFELALAELWRSWGVRPAAVLGHSLGEYAAAAAAGVFTAEDAIRLAAARGQIFAGLHERGAMLAVHCPVDELDHVVADLGMGPLAVAAINAPDQVTVSGQETAVAALKEECRRHGWLATPLTVTHAFHSPLVAPAAELLTVAARRITHQSAQLAWATNLTGALAGEQECGPDYWARQLVGPIRFADAVGTLAGTRVTVYVEAGPGGTLCGLGRVQPGTEQSIWVATGLSRHPVWSTVHSSLARLDLAGVPVDWEAFHAPFKRRRIEAPGYPFARDRYWMDSRPRPRPFEQAAGPSASRPNPALAALLDESPTAQPPRLQVLLADYLAELFAHWLVHRPEPFVPLAALGLDSMTVIELRSRICTDLGVDVPLADLMDDLTLSSLTDVLVVRWPAQASAQAAMADRDVSSADQALPDLDTLSAAEMTSETAARLLAVLDGLSDASLRSLAGQLDIVPEDHDG
jgi:acyl transferase domain-containing protein